MTHPRLAFILALMLTAVACSADGSADPASSGSATDPSLAAQLATTDLWAGDRQDVEVGVFSSTADGGVQLVTFGTVDLTFTFLGSTGGGSNGAGEAGPEATASYLPAPTTMADGSGPSLSNPGAARGVYLARDITFDHAGLWQVDVTADIDGMGEHQMSASFPVFDRPQLPAPGDPALKTQNLTMRSKDVPLAAIDSRALDGAPVPDPELHRWTIARALAEHRPILAIFATPTFCQSRLCGPTTEAVERLAARYDDRAVFIHVEIWKDNVKQVVNRAAADWLYRNGDLTEPWMYLIGADGRIQDRWGPLFDVAEVSGKLAALPPMSS